MLDKLTAKSVNKGCIMVFATYLDKNGSECVGVLSPDRKFIYSIAELGFAVQTMRELIAGYSVQLCESLQIKIETAQNGVALEDIKLLSPIPHPHHDLLCVGKNYVEHAQEGAQYNGVVYEKPKLPVYFCKRVDCAVGHEGDIPSHSKITSKLDYEAELAVVIGKTCSNVSEDEVNDYIFGYTIANDVSARDLQYAHIQFTFGKSLDGFSPIGPWIVTADEFTFPPKLQIKARVNGELRQNDNTGNLIFGIPRIISELSQGITLEPGDILLTGTPSGVGLGFQPPKFLSPGDIVECEIEKIGLLRNTVR